MDEDIWDHRFGNVNYRKKIPFPPIMDVLIFCIPIVRSLEKCPFDLRGLMKVLPIQSFIIILSELTNYILFLFMWRCYSSRSLKFF